MIETEIKLRIEGPEIGRAMLAKAGFQIVHSRAFEANEVLDTPDGSLRASGRLLRLRQADGRNVLTFKGVSKPGPHKSRPEFEINLSDFDIAATIFQELGYQPSFRYEKYRTEFQRPGDSGIAMLDETPIGTFLELEGDSQWIDVMAATLGYGPQDYVTSSYGALYFEDCASKGLKPTHMVFKLAEI